MPHLVVYPFYSQQDKLTGQFILDTCGTSKMLAWLIDRIQEELGWNCTVVLPDSNCTPHPFKCAVYKTAMPINNRHNRIHWDTVALRRLFQTADIALLNHETLATPLRALFPRLKIVQQCLVEPQPAELFVSAWKNADLVVVHGEFAQQYIKNMYNIPAESWLMGYDASISQQAILRDMDVFFATRSSVTNYTHHQEFIEATKQLHKLKIVYADPTNYLCQLLPTEQYIGRYEYATALQRTKVAVFLHSGWFSFALREAIAAGCIPVVLDHPSFDELLGEKYAYKTQLDTIAKTVFAALHSNLQLIPKESFQDAWPKIRRDLEALCQS